MSEQEPSPPSEISPPDDDFSNHPLAYLLQPLGNIASPNFFVPPAEELVAQARNTMFIEALWHQHRVNNIVATIGQLPSMFLTRSMLPIHESSSIASEEDTSDASKVPPSDKFIWPDGDMEYAMPDSNIKTTGVPHLDGGWDKCGASVTSRGNSSALVFMCVVKWTVSLLLGDVMMPSTKD